MDTTNIPNIPPGLFVDEKPLNWAFPPITDWVIFLHYQRRTFAFEMDSPSLDCLKDNILRRGIDLERNGLKITCRDWQGRTTRIDCDEDLAHCFRCPGGTHIRLSRRASRRTQQCSRPRRLQHPTSGDSTSGDNRRASHRMQQCSRPRRLQHPTSGDNRRILKDEIKLEPKEEIKLEPKLEIKLEPKLEMRKKLSSTFVKDPLIKFLLFENPTTIPFWGCPYY
ncbi:PREDICTED: uncharacterized protein LOC109179378 [Ipomoea nil]|uniref:uncharacterized protein LOC109179378 n=1 Tax=Ipomoea nil TaxID=35883 RepID=UPI000900D35C|nr:PREDICTED: uncharacterized protein LOC109179378 [Ipomoea nil]